MTMGVSAFPLLLFLRFSWLQLASCCLPSKAEWIPVNQMFKAVRNQRIHSSLLFFFVAGSNDGTHHTDLGEDDVVKVLLVLIGVLAPVDGSKLEHAV